MTDRTTGSARAIWLGGGLALLALVGLAFGPTLDNGLVWDDATNVLQMRAHRTPDLAGLRWAFGSFVMGHYQPLTWLSYALQEQVLGQQPRHYHAVDLLLHLLNAAWVALLGARLRAWARGHAAPSDAAVGLLGAALFALHPLRVESVAWATERRDVLSAFFFLAAVHAHLDWAGSRRPGTYLRGLTACALCLLAKAQVVLPLALLVLDVFPLRRLREERPGHLVLEKGPHFVLAGLASGVAVWAQAASGALVSASDHGLAARLAQAAYGLVFYVRATFSLAWYPLHERPVPLDPWAPPFLMAGGIVVAAALALHLSRRAPAVLAATAWYVVLLLPVLGLAQSGVQLVADRYSYLATAGFGLLAACAAARLCSGGWRRLVGAAALLAVLLGLAALTRRQVAVWRDDESLWQHVLERGPSALAYNNLASLAAERGDLASAVELLRRSLETVPIYHRSWTSLLRVLEQRPDAVAPAAWAGVARALRRGIGFHDRSAAAHRILGLVLARAGDIEGARAELERALLLSPGHAAARRDLEGLAPR